MKKRKIDAYIVPSSDAHQSEYVSKHWKGREWISGFTGSAGTAVITLEDGGLWTDGRYYIQAENQLKGSGIQLFKMGSIGVPTYAEWLKNILKRGSVVGFDGNVFSVNSVKNMEKLFKSKEIKLEINFDLIDEIWEDRPLISDKSIFIHEEKYAGKSSKEKLNEVREDMQNKGANYYLLTSLDDIAWLLNIRGEDVPNNPVTIANVVVSKENCYLFIDKRKVSKDVMDELKIQGIEVRKYEKTKEFLKELKGEDTITFDYEKTNICLYNAINDAAHKIESDNVTTNLKSIKNKVEIENLHKCQVVDGVAMVKFIKWLKNSVEKENITEISAENKLEKFRSKGELFKGLSFDTIAGYKDHAAMMHYKANKDTDYTLKNEGLFLVDSGGQYLNGTTDITRTIVLGKLTKEEKRDFTLVLKSHIALSKAKFLYGATGSNLDVLARKPMWDEGLDYKCGTGHGVGFYLNVHEGPQRLSQVPNNIKLEENMVITNEPGIYKEGKHGIRTENIMLVLTDNETEFGKFMKFESMTYCPIDLDGVDKYMLNEEEVEWLNKYHEMVYEKLSPCLNEEEKEWLKKETRNI